MSGPWDQEYYLNGYVDGTPEMPSMRVCARCKSRECLSNQQLLRNRHNGIESNRAYLNKLCTNIMMKRIRHRLTEGA